MKPSLGLAVLALAAPLSAATIFPEIPVSVPVYDRAVGDQHTLAVTTDGQDFLAIWTDRRSGRSELYAARVRATGEVLDPTGIRIGPAGDFRFLNALWSGTSYVILWNDENANHRSIKIARVGNNGVLIEPPRTLLLDGYAISSRFAATNGSRVVVAYQRESEFQVAVLDRDSPSQFRVAVLDREGALIGDHSVPRRPVNSYALTVASNGSGFLAVWIADPIFPISIEVVPIDTDGIPAATPRTIVSSNSRFDAPIVTTDRQDYLVLLHAFFSEERSAVRVSPQGEVISGPHATGAPPASTTEEAQVVWTGTRYLLVWMDSGEQAVRAIPLDRDGRALQPASSLSDWASGGRAGAQAIAVAAASGLLLWHDARLSRGLYITQDVFAATFSVETLAAADATLVSLSATRQTTPGVAFSGDEHLVVWNEETGVYMSRIRADGSSPDGRGIPIAESPRHLTLNPRVVFDGENYLVAWYEVGVGIRFAVINRTEGRPFPERSGIVTGCAFEFSIAAGTGAVLVVWSDCEMRGIKAARVSRDGRVLDPVPLEVTRTSAWNGSPALASNGAMWLLAWEESIGVPDGVEWWSYAKKIRAARVSPELTLLDPQPIPLTNVSGNDYKSSAEVPAVASDGSEFLIAWQTGELWGPRRDIVATHVRANGTIGEPEPLLIAHGFAPAVVWDDERYVLAWTESNRSRDVVATYVGRADEHVARPRLLVATSATDENSVFLTRSGPNRVTATYTRVAPEPIYTGVERVFLRHIQTLPRTRATRR